MIHKMIIETARLERDFVRYLVEEVDEHVQTDLAECGAQLSRSEIEDLIDFELRNIAKHLIKTSIKEMNE